MFEFGSLQPLLDFSILGMPGLPFSISSLKKEIRERLFFGLKIQI
jgi:hypothetical protein